MKNQLKFGLFFLILFTMTFKILTISAKENGLSKERSNSNIKKLEISKEEHTHKKRLERFNNKYSINVKNAEKKIDDVNKFSKRTSSVQLPEDLLPENNKNEINTEVATELESLSLNSSYLTEKVNDINASDIYYDYNLENHKYNLEQLPINPHELYEQGLKNKYSYHQIITKENEILSKEIMKDKNFKRKNAKDVIRAWRLRLKNPSKRTLTQSKGASNDVVVKDLKDDSKYTSKLPYYFTFTKQPYIEIKDITSRGINTWICSNEKKIYNYKVDSTFKNINALNNENVDCQKITNDIKGNPIIININNEICLLKEIYNKSYIWKFIKTCAEDVSCGISGVCYAIPCQTDPEKDFILKLEGDQLSRYASVKPTSMTGYDEAMSLFNQTNEGTTTKVSRKTSQSNQTSTTKTTEKKPEVGLVFTRIAVGSGIEGDVLYLVTKNKDLWRLEKKYWSLLESNINDVAVSDRNDVYFSNSRGVELWERDSLEPRRIFKGSSKNLAAGQKLWIQTENNLIFTSDNNIS